MSHDVEREHRSTVASPAAPDRPPGFLAELRAFAWQHKLLWMVPMGVVLALIAALLFASYRSVPFHYTVM